MSKKNQFDSIYQKMVGQPLPPMTLRIGVSGHRKLTSDSLDQLRQQLSMVYKDIYAVVNKFAPNRAQNVNEISSRIYDTESTPVIRIISPLAEGADRLCIDPELIDFEPELACILPFSRERYTEDFLPGKSVVDPENGTVEEFDRLLQRIGYGNPEASIIELDGESNSNSTAAYNYCSRVLVEHSDIIIALYKSDPTTENGTEAVVKKAKDSGVPVIQISTDSGAKTILHSNRTGEESDPPRYSSELLFLELERILLFSDVFERTPDEESDTKKSILNRFERYPGEGNLKVDESRTIDFSASGPIKLGKTYKSPVANAYRLFKGVVATPERVRKEIIDKKLHEPCGRKLTAQQHPSPASGSSMHRFYAAYLRADNLAGYYASTHRSTFLLIYCLGALALISAAIPLAFEFKEMDLVLLLLIKASFLASILYLYRQDHHHHNDYHGRWLEYRYLAEYLRPMYYLIMLGKTYPLMSVRDTGGSPALNSIGHNDKGRYWLHIHIETLIRWAGFNHSRIDDDYKSSAGRMINQSWIQEQIKYHAGNAATMQVLGSRLASWCKFLFFATVAVVLLKLAIVIAEINSLVHLPDWLTHSITLHTISLTTVVLPILASAFFAIRNHAEFDISAQRSRSMLAFLCAQQEKLMAIDRQDSADRLTFQLLKTAGKTTEEVSEWLEIYEVKEAEPG